MTAFFWTDMIPEFGTSGSLTQFFESFSFNFHCFFGTSSAIAQEDYCHYCGAFGLLFMALYITSYIFGTWMTMYASANLSTIVSAISPVIVVLFWVTFPSVNAWAGGAPYTFDDILCNVLGLC